MLYRTCHKLQKHKLVCEIHGKSLTDVRFGVLLFGGLNSSLVDIVASRHLNDTEVANVWGAQFHIFSVSLKVMMILIST
jgi:asparagine synthetase B (glutamine-hydrolysing)